MTALARIGAWLKTRWVWLLTALVAVWWALRERRGRQRAEARADLEADLGEIEKRRAAETAKAAAEAAKARADIEAERAQAEVKARVDIQAAERALETVREEYRETGAVTSESQRLWDEMRKSGRLP